MFCDTVRPPHVANKIFPMATSEIGRHVESSQNQYYISTGHRLCPIIIKLAIFDLQTKLNKPAEQLFLIPNRLAKTANQIWRQTSRTGSKPVLSNSWTYHSQTWYIDSWHPSGDSQTIWWPLTSGDVKQRWLYLPFRPLTILTAILTGFDASWTAWRTDAC